MTLQDRLFPATVMPNQDWWHALWPNPDGVISGTKGGTKGVSIK